MLDFAAPESGEVFSGRKSLKTAAKSVGKQTLKNIWLAVVNRRIFPTRSTKQSSRSRRDIFRKISRCSCQTTFFGTNLLSQCLEILEGKSQLLTMSCPRMNKNLLKQLTCGNCIEIEFQKDRKYYVDLRHSFLALKLKLVRVCDYDTNESKEKKKEHKDESVVFTETGTDDEEEEEVARVTYLNNIMHSIFSIVEVYINNQRIYNSREIYAHKSYISNNFKAAISEYKGVLLCEGYDYEQDPEDINNPLPDPFFARKMELLSRPDGFNLNAIFGIDFFSTSELIYPNMKIRLRLIRARTNFYMIINNPNVSLAIVDFSLYNRRIALKNDYHGKRRDVLAYVPVGHNHLDAL